MDFTHNIRVSPLLEQPQALRKYVSPSNNKLLVAVQKICRHGNSRSFCEACRHKREFLCTVNVKGLISAVEFRDIHESSGHLPIASRVAQIKHSSLQSRGPLVRKDFQTSAAKRMKLSQCELRALKQTVLCATCFEYTVYLRVLYNSAGRNGDNFP